MPLSRSFQSDGFLFLGKLKTDDESQTPAPYWPHVDTRKSVQTKWKLGQQQLKLGVSMPCVA